LSGPEVEPKSDPKKGIILPQPKTIEKGSSLNYLRTAVLMQPADTAASFSSFAIFFFIFFSFFD